MDLGLEGKLAFVTGASKGIGKAVADALAAEGCALALASRTQTDLERLADELRRRHGTEVTVHAIDAANAADRETVTPVVGKADILVNCAGAIPAGSFEALSEDAWRQAWDLKVFGYLAMSRIFYTAMKQRGAGVIVNVIGDAGEQPKPEYIAGSSGNAALMAFTRALGAEGPSHGVRVVAVNPGLTASDRSMARLQTVSQRRFGTPDRWPELIAGLNLPFGRMAEASEVAAVVAFLASARASYVSGTIVTVDGGKRFRSAT